MRSRRDFLQMVTVSAIGLPLVRSANAISSQSFLSSSYDGPIMRVAIMGLGTYGTIVAQAMLQCKRAKLVGVISGTPAKVTTWQTRYNIPEKNCYNYENFDNIKNNPDIDVVYVTTPNALHHDLVLRVAKAGKHVICEKPMALNAKQGQDMVDGCKKAGVKLLVGYRMHFEPKTLEVVRMRKEGEFGKIMFFQGLSGFRIGDPTQWRLNKQMAGGGSLMDVGIYALNGARYMIGEEPIWVTAEETKTNPEKFKEGVDETIMFQLGFPGGAVASCLSTYNMNNMDHFFLSGEKGFADLQPAWGYGPIQGRTNKGPITIPTGTQQTFQLDEMAAMIFENKQPILPADGEEAVRDLKIIDAIYSAVKSGKKMALNA